MIKSKKCLLCNLPAFSKGYCKKHCSFKELKQNRRIKQVREKTAEKNKEKSERRNVYFEYHLERCTHSSESLLPIPNPTKSNICHIFSKSLHRSLEDNLENCIYLTQSEHERFDKLLLSLEFEKIEIEFKNSWPNTCTIIKKLVDLCEENTVFTRAIKKYLNDRESKS